MSRPDPQAIFRDILSKDTRNPTRLCTFPNPRDYEKSEAEKAEGTGIAINKPKGVTGEFHSRPLEMVPIACDGSLFYFDGMTPSPGGYFVVTPDREQVLAVRVRQSN